MTKCMAEATPTSLLSVLMFSQHMASSVTTATCWGLAVRDKIVHACVFSIVLDLDGHFSVLSVL